MVSKLTKCEACHKDLSMLASACPSCGARRKPPWWAVASLVAVVGFAVVAVAGVADETPPASPPASSESAKPIVADSAAEVTAGELHEEYKANAIGADAKYRDKVLRVTGVVDRVGRDEKPFLVFWVLEAGDDGLRASFSTAAGLGELKRLQAVVVRCRGGSSRGSPTLTECVFEGVVDED